MMTLAGYAFVLFVAFWLVGPFVGMLAAPFLVKLSEYRLRSAGIRVAGDWTPEQRQEVQRVSDQTGRDAVLWGRTITASIASIVYLTLAMPTAPGWIEFVPVGIVWFLSKDRLLFPLTALAIQLGTRVFLG